MSSNNKNIQKIAKLTNLLSAKPLEYEVLSSSIPYFNYTNGVVTKSSNNGSVIETETIKEEYRQQIIDSLLALMHELDDILSSIDKGGSFIIQNRRMCLPEITIDGDAIELKTRKYTKCIEVKTKYIGDPIIQNTAIKIDDYIKAVDVFINQINSCKEAK